MDEKHDGKYDDKYTVMTTQPVEKLVLKLAGPSIVIMLVTSLYNMADTYFVSSLGTSATGAVGIVFSLMAIIQAVGFFFGHGTGNYIARQLGAKKVSDAEEMAATGLLTSIGAGLLIGVFGYIFMVPLARMLGATDTILPYATDYMRYILIGAPWMTGALTLNNQLRYQGSSLYGMVGIVSGAALNIVLDPILIHLLGWGISGAAIATALSQFVSFLLLWHGTRRGGNVRIRLRLFRPSVAKYKEMVRGGFPSLCRQLLASVAAIVLNQIAATYGDAAIAGISIAQKVVMFAASSLLGFGQGFQPVCGFNYGAGLYGRVKKAFWFCIKFSTVVLVGLSVAGFFLAPNIMAFFNADEVAVAATGIRYLRYSSLTFPLMGWVIICNMMMQTIGMAGRASLLAVARQGLFFLPMAFVLPRLFGLGGLLASQPVADVLSFGLALFLGFDTLRKMK